MAGNRVIRFRAQKRNEDGTTVLTGDQMVAVNISPILYGPLMDLALTAFVTALDERVAEYLDVDYVYPQHDWNVDARAFIELEYEIDDEFDGEVEVPVPDGVKLVKPGRSPYRMAIGNIPNLIDRLDRIYRDTDPEDYGETIDLLDVILD